MNLSAGLKLCGALLWLPAVAAADVDALHWMSGCWSVDGAQPGSLEQWTAPAGGTMLGLNRTVRDGRTVAFEFLRIVTEEDGETTLVASPSGQETARFRMVEQASDLAVFENPDHDFPQRISYRLVAAGRLLGRIEGTIDGTPRTVDFPMTRTDCDGGNADE